MEMHLLQYFTPEGSTEVQEIHLCSSQNGKTVKRLVVSGQDMHSWFGHCASSREILGSIPNGIECFH